MRIAATMSGDNASTEARPASTPSQVSDTVSRGGSKAAVPRRPRAARKRKKRDRGHQRTRDQADDTQGERPVVVLRLDEQRSDDVARDIHDGKGRGDARERGVAEPGDRDGDQQRGNGPGNPLCRYVWRFSMSVGSRHRAHRIKYHIKVTSNGTIVVYGAWGMR